MTVADQHPAVHVTAVSADGQTVATRDTPLHGWYGTGVPAAAARLIRRHADELRTLLELPADAPVTVRLPAGRLGDLIGEQLRDDEEHLLVDPWDGP